MKKKPVNPNPKLNANFISKLSFWWLYDLFRQGKKGNLDATDLYDVLPENVSEPLGNQLEVSWEKELTKARKKNRKPSLWKAIISTFGSSFAKYGVSMFILNVVRLMQPVILAQLIWYFEPLSSMSTTEGYIYATALVLVTMLQTIIVRQAHLKLQEIGMRARIACSSLIYRKVIKLSSSSGNQATSGAIINLLSNDVANFEKFVLHLHYIWIMPFVVGVITYLIWRQLGIAAFAGILSMTILIIPMQVYWYKMTSKLRSKGAGGTDKRVLLIEEIINGIRVIKMYAWEKYFVKLVFLARKYEIGVILKRFYVKSVRMAFSVFTHRASLFCTILAYVMQDKVIAADRIYSTVHYFSLAQTIMAQFFPEAVSLCAEVNVSIKRIEKFLLLNEVESKVKILTSNGNVNSISIRNATAVWEKNVNSISLCDINVNIPSKKLYAVVGPIGSGKSSLLKLILGELGSSSGEVSVSGTISYVSQEPWLFTGSVRENILFGESYDQVKYSRIVKACSLIQDFDHLPYGDKTLVGERGMALSGGQCARVNLARAVYRDADIYLLDDPLSAVDSQVGQSLFQNCINGLLKDKTRILVTHQMQYLKEADAIILLNSGQLEYEGSFQNLVNNNKYLHYLPFLRDNEEKIMTEEKSVNDSTMCTIVHDLDVNKKDNSKNPEESHEISATGQISKSLYWKYFKSSDSYFVLSVLILLLILTQLSISGFDYWLAYWTKQEEKRVKYSLNATNITSHGNMSAAKYLPEDIALSVSGGFIAGIIVFSIVRNILFYKTVLNSSKNIHNRMFTRLIRSPMQFFNVNPAGRILNRFSKDTGTVDETMPNAMLDVIERMFITMGIVTQILIINWWTVFPLLIVVYLFVKVNDIYLSTVQDIKRLEGNAKSPIFSLVNSSLQGLLTIRSCRAQKIVRKEFDIHQDNHTSAHYLVLVSSSAFGFWLDFISLQFLSFVAYSFIFFNNNNTFAGDVGLALTQILTICGTLQFAMKQVAEVVSQMTSVERMFQFTKLDQEGPFETEEGQLPNNNWPTDGEMRFENLYLRYSEEEEPILKNLNFTIKPCTKIGIVGRTGAGKSSLISALFRFSKTDGSLIIDNVNTKNIGLYELRNRISIIPQEPILFTASLRDNIDPFHKYDDASLWSALEDVKLNKSFDSLDQLVDRGGTNLSTGQRQLLCLARAIVRRNKILIMDEATANVDPVTDEFIQKLVRIKFKDCTVLTIAHRLNTIMDSDKILVMDNGRVVEFDEPRLLLQKPDGLFSRMVQQTDIINCKGNYTK